MSRKQNNKNSTVKDWMAVVILRLHNNLLERRAVYKDTGIGNNQVLKLKYCYFLLHNSLIISKILRLI